ncbi:3-octaprenyl-4-hydroxybenzoate carboxy-lyase [Gossypium arboreum]|uniref:3-octaprenyl-4-hydroxybenzoate carboxy-lyase n=1 Tax=Gossypium arboreum TaxID=29729 RepID=A0A0B0N9C7_GOSAR|nr:3-octaprenyl-4-hydroxybenzoate carboxy-lyase [Gossypium arboreum]
MACFELGVCKIGRKMAWSMAYFGLRGKRNGRMPQLCLTHDHVARPCVLGVDFENNLVWHGLAHSLVHRRVCWPCDPSQRVTWGRTWARTRPCVPISNVHTACDTGMFGGRFCPKPLPSMFRAS